MSKEYLISYFNENDDIFYNLVKSKYTIIKLWFAIFDKLLNGEFRLICDIKSNDNNHEVVDRIFNDKSKGCKGYIIIHRCQSMQRVLITNSWNNSTKIYTINFPFVLSNEESITDDTSFRFIYKSRQRGKYESESFTFELISHLRACINSIESGKAVKDAISSHLDDFVDEYDINKCCELEEVLPNIIHELMILDEGYIRFDHDIQNSSEIQKSEDSERFKHPTYHFDIFWGQPSWKIGLNKSINHESILDILSPDTNCSLLSYGAHKY